MADPILEELDGQGFAERPGLVDEVASLWCRAFAGPPWHASREQRAERSEVMRAQLGRSGTRAALASDAAGAAVGAGWAWRGDRAPDDGLHAAVRSVVGPVLAARLWSREARVLVELMVDPGQQGRGTGARLLDSLVGNQDAWLLTHPEGAGVRLYERTGWSDVGHLDHRGTPLTVMVRTRPEVEAT